MRLFRIALYTTLLVALSAAFAQTRRGDTIVDIPFNFVVNGQTLPSGHYIVHPLDNGGLRISNGDAAGVYVFAHTATRDSSDGSKLVFHRFGSTYFLSAVWTQGRQSGLELARSRAEREMEAARAEMQLAVVRPVN